MTKTLEGDFAVEFKALDLLNSRYSVLRGGDKAVRISYVSVSAVWTFNKYPSDLVCTYWTTASQA